MWSHHQGALVLRKSTCHKIQETTQLRSAVQDTSPDLMADQSSIIRFEHAIKASAYYG